MSVLGYSELIKEIYGLTPDSIESEISILLKSKPSQMKINMLKSLATKDKATVSEILRVNNRANTGGSFKSISRFFDELSRLNILKKENIGRRTYFSFSEKSTLKEWLKD